MRKNNRSETKYIAVKKERKEGRKKEGKYGRRQKSEAVEERDG